MIAFKTLISYSIFVMTNHLKANQDRLELWVHFIKKSSRRSITNLEDIYICKQNRHSSIALNVANETIGCKTPKWQHMSNFLQMFEERKEKEDLF